MRVRAFILAGAAVAALAAAPAHAQGGYGQQGYGRGGYDDRTGPRDGRDPAGDGQDRGGDGQDRSPSPGAPAGGAGYADADQAPPDLGRDLNLRADQRAALEAYQSATTPTAAEQQRSEADFHRLAGMTTPQRLDFSARQMVQDQSEFARRAQAVRRFYAELTPVQQRRFDQLTAPQPGGDEEGAQGGPPGAYGRGGDAQDERPPR